MSSIEITSLNKENSDDITKIIFNAFENYPLMTLLFGDNFQESTTYMTQFMCDGASTGDKLLIGAFVENKLQGVAFITPPINPENNNNEAEREETSLEKEFARLIGEESLMRLEAYSNLKKSNKPSSPHFYINSLSVNPQNQGQGIGSAIIKQIHQMSEQHPESCGVALDTQTEENVAYYQRFGYSISNIVELETVKNWFMFRPDSI